MGARGRATPSPRTRACRRRSARTASTTRTRSPRSWTPCAGARSRRRTGTPSRRRSAAARTSRPTSSSRCAARCSRRGPTCCSPTTWAWARRSRPAWSSRSCCCGTAPGRSIIVCPPSLSLKWRDEMREKFGLEFEIVNSELMAQGAAHPRAERQPVPAVPAGDRVAWRGCRRCAPSGCCARCTPTSGTPARARRYAFDVLIVDEAHHVAPASPTAATGFRGYAVDSQRTIATRELAEKVRAPAVPVRDPAQRLLRVVHRADGDDRRPPVQARRQPGRARAARHRGPPAQGGPDGREGLPHPGAQDAGLHAVEGRGGEVRAARPDPRRERAAQRAGQVGRHRGDAVQEAVPVQPVVVRADPAAVHRVRRRIGPRQPTTRTSTTRRFSAAGSPTRKRATPQHPEFTALRHSKALRPARRRDGQGHRVADRLGPGVREPAGRPAHRADRVPGRRLPSRRHLEQRAGRGVHRVRRRRWTGSSGSWPSTATGRAPSSR